MSLLSVDEAVERSEQNHDLLISGIVSRSIYISADNVDDIVLAPLRDLRSRLRDEKSLFVMQQLLLKSKANQSELDDFLGDFAASVIDQSTVFKDDARETISALANSTLEDVEQSRRILLLFCLLIIAVVGFICYWLLYRQTLLPLLQITNDLVYVGTERFPSDQQEYSMRELAALSTASGELNMACLLYTSPSPRDRG